MTCFPPFQSPTHNSGILFCQGRGESKSCFAVAVITPPAQRILSVLDAWEPAVPCPAPHLQNSGEEWQCLGCAWAGLCSLLLHKPSLGPGVQWRNSWSCWCQQRLLTRALAWRVSGAQPLSLWASKIFWMSSDSSERECLLAFAMLEEGCQHCIDAACGPLPGGN